MKRFRHYHCDWIIIMMMTWGFRSHAHVVVAGIVARNVAVVVIGLMLACARD